MRPIVSALTGEYPAVSKATAENMSVSDFFFMLMGLTRKRKEKEY